MKRSRSRSRSPLKREKQPRLSSSSRQTVSKDYSNNSRSQHSTQSQHNNDQQRNRSSVNGRGSHNESRNKFLAEVFNCAAFIKHFEKFRQCQDLSDDSCRVVKEKFTFFKSQVIDDQSRNLLAAKYNKLFCNKFESDVFFQIIEIYETFRRYAGDGTSVVPQILTAAGPAQSESQRVNLLSLDEAEELATNTDRSRTSRAGFANPPADPEYQLRSYEAYLTLCNLKEIIGPFEPNSKDCKCTWDEFWIMWRDNGHLIRIGEPLKIAAFKKLLGGEALEIASTFDHSVPGNYKAIMKALHDTYSTETGGRPQTAAIELEKLLKLELSKCADKTINSCYLDFLKAQKEQVSKCVQAGCKMNTVYLMQMEKLLDVFPVHFFNAWKADPKFPGKTNPDFEETGAIAYLTYRTFLQDYLTSQQCHVKQEMSDDYVEIPNNEESEMIENGNMRNDVAVELCPASTSVLNQDTHVTEALRGNTECPPGNVLTELNNEVPETIVKCNMRNGVGEPFLTTLEVTQGAYQEIEVNHEAHLIDSERCEPIRVVTGNDSSIRVSNNHSSRQIPSLFPTTADKGSVDISAVVRDCLLPTPHIFDKLNKRIIRTTHEKGCLYCQIYSHSTFECNLPLSRKEALVFDQWQLCQNCLNHHSSERCHSGYVCKRCRDPHHTTLCPH